MIFNRRRFLTGGWPGPDAPKAPGLRDISRFAIQIQVRPDRLDAALDAIRASVALDIVARDPAGRVILAGTGGDASVVDTLAHLTQIAGVVSATLTRSPADVEVHT